DKQTQIDQVIHGIPPPLQPAIDREWHAEVTREERHILMGRLVRAMFAYPVFVHETDYRIRQLTDYSRDKEKEFFDRADGRCEYIHLMSEKIYRITMKVEERKRGIVKPEREEDDLDWHAVVQEIYNDVIETE
ncbi:hypothetical protein PFISCL1PPCAC_1618, partial [Pristionchus fissidentatus]